VNDPRQVGGISKIRIEPIFRELIKFYFADQSAGSQSKMDLEETIKMDYQFSSSHLLDDFLIY
jgi:hypothetical protein